MAHPLAPDFLQRDLDTAFLADDAAVLHPLVLAAQALVVLDRPKDACAEQAVPFWLEGPVVDGLGLLDFTVGPGEDPLGGRQRNANLVERLRRGERAERVGCKFLIHVLSLKAGRGVLSSAKLGAPAASLAAGIPHPSSSTVSLSSMFSPRPRTSFTSTLKLSGTPASKLSSPFTIDS